MVDPVLPTERCQRQRATEPPTFVIKRWRGDQEQWRFDCSSLFFCFSEVKSPSRRNRRESLLCSVISPAYRMKLMPKRKRILFLCTGNCCRSPMAEGLLRHMLSDRFEALSAGVTPAGYIHPRAISTMAELGIDISTQTSKSIHDFLPPSESTPDVVVGLCVKAEKICPDFPAHVERWNWPIDDPYYSSGSEDQKMSEFRRVRDEIKAAIETRFFNL